MKRYSVVVFILIAFFVVSGFALEYKGITYEQWKDILAKGNREERALAIEAVGAIGASDSEELLIPYLKSEDDQMKFNAVWALGQIQSAKAAEEICWMLGTDNDPRIDGALVNIGEPAIQWLVVKLKLAALLENFEEGTRIARIMVDIQSPEGLAEVAAFLSKLLSDPDRKDEAKNMLSQIGDKAVDPLIISLKTTYDNQLKIDILKTLVLIGNEKSLDTFYSFVSDTDPTIRTIVANALGKIKSTSNTDFLIAMLRDTDENVRTQAIVSLGELQDSKSVVYLLTSLKDENPLIRAMAAYSLGRIQDVRSVYPLINLLDDTTVLKAVDPNTGKTTEQKVLDFAARALVKINDPRGIQELENRGIKVLQE
ncbi:MAG TPA: HEAT repeat domain-containing protein [Thermotogota bacterium]|nr:HEAT repeat domain-containing protein [Thermotogota bacterium]HPJ88569.1 HEAT repeat domain-containing protein [Thermotogota bacterium]HPR96720.1 HEAT repeat domain-containing protein [Thermotogota bacterium]